MKKKLLAMLLTFAMVLPLCPAFELPVSAAEAHNHEEVSAPALSDTKSEATSGDYTYKVSNGEATITDVNTSISGVVTIPSTLGGYPVTSIGYRAFYCCSSLTSVTIPEGVTSIGDSAFEGCSSLTTITIPDGVTSIGSGAFSSCSSLTAITIPDSVTSIGGFAFWGCSILTTITVDAGNACFSSQDGILFNKEKTTLIRYPAGKTSASYVVPDSVTSIGEDAFYDCDSLTTVTIPDGVTSIGEGAFMTCSTLNAITIPDSVTSIGKEAFYWCSSLTTISIPDSVTSIGSDAFYDTQWLNNQPDGLVYAGKVAYDVKGTCPSNVVIKEGTLGIADDAFYGCSSLTTITIPDSVTSIGRYAFTECYNLTTITIPDSVTSIGDYAFYKCGSLKSITIPDSVTSIGSLAFYYCSSLTTITIPDSVTSIGNYAFEACESLTTITISESVTSISFGAFYSCSSLTTVTIPNSVTTIGYFAFYDCSSLKDVWYEGDSRSSITIGSSNSALTSATWHYSSCMENEGVWTHIYDNACDTDCNICKHIRTITHTYDNSCDDNCNECGFVRVPPHSYDNSSDLKCNLCGINRPVSPTVLSFTDTAVTLTFTEGMEYSIDGGETWQKSNVFEGLLPNTSYTFCQRIEETTLLNASDKSVGTKVTTKKSTQTEIPQPPMVESVTKTSITLVAVEGCEYSRNGTSWQSSTTFTGLEEATTYTFYQRYKATTTHYAGEKSEGTAISTQKGVQNAPKAPMAEKVTHNSVTLASFDGVEYSMDGVTWQKKAIFRGLSPLTTYTFYQRLAETEKLYASPASEALQVTTPETPPYVPGDLDGVEGITSADAIYLLYHGLFGADRYPVDQVVDFDGDGAVTSADAIYLLYHALFGADRYPI